ncbi:hypothetical protein LTR62_008613 [Meristemomyces frigidus]|uniref:BAR domain-containing protein n=1 Tax=Meristemomyces frigidus TaxID=1508187 RepID=A0AAN7T9L7_9PEZI|nr:hypothetical protein LTR62_008613 [Meristemomyces frigidus]
MIVNKKFDRLKQWGRERMGSEVKTDTSDEFKALQTEMQLRQDGMEKLDRAAKGYLKSVSTRSAGEEKEKVLPVAFFGSSMVSHGDDFEPDSEFGQCLSSLGRANERIGRMQETYSVNASATWLESIERSLVQMKEYQSAKKKLESRRLAYDTAQQKMQKSKKEDFKMEEELRSQKAKFEESSEDVYRRMLDIKEAEADSVADLSSFLEAELSYYDRCREVLLQLKRDWPAQLPASNRSDTASPVNGLPRRGTRSRASSMTQRFANIAEDEPLEPPSRPTISSRVPSGQNSPRREMAGFDFPVRPTPNQRSASGFEGPTSLYSRPESPAGGMPRLSRVPTDPTALLAAATSGAGGQLRIGKRNEQTADIFSDDQSDYSSEPSSAFDRLQHNRTSSFSQENGGRKAPPPPPPPSRSKKPPPPPPLKRSALSTSEIPHY